MKICTREAWSIAGFLIEQFLVCESGVLGQDLVSHIMRDSLFLFLRGG
jgi:hypothetical protein